MSLAKICRKFPGTILSRFRHVHSPAISATSEADIEVLKKQDARISKTISGISVVSAENYSPLSHISVLVKAGSRYEDQNNLGISHFLRNCATLSSTNHTSFAMTRHMEIHGSVISITGTREYMMYTLQCNRDNIDMTLPILAQYICHPALKHWEIDATQHRMEYDLAMLKENPEASFMEALHKASLKGGLLNSVYSPSFMLGKHNTDMLKAFLQSTFVSHRTTVAGLGVDHDQLMKLVTDYFEMKALTSAETTPSKFIAGELRIENALPATRVAIVAEGASLANINEMLSLGVLQCILGIGSQTKFGYGQYSRIGAAAAKATDKPFAATSLNLSYSDAGIFGVYVAGCPSQIREIIKSVVSQMKETTKNLSSEDIQFGKHALKAKMLLELANSKEFVEDMAMKLAASGTFMTSQELEKTIDALTPADINAVACKVMKIKPSMVAFGRLQNTPYLEELL